MKKILSVILVVVMLVTATFGGGLTAKGATAFEDYHTIILDEDVIISTDENSGIAIFSFIPEVTDTYIFYSYDNVGLYDRLDTYGYLYDSEMNEITHNDDGGGYMNFKIQYTLTAGKQYYFKSRPYSSDASGTYTVKLIKLGPATGIEISQGDDISGSVGQSLYLSVDFIPNESIEEEITWSSSDDEIVSVGEYGELQLLREGTAVITATSENGLTDTCTVTAKEIPILTVENLVAISASVGYGTMLFNVTETGVYKLSVSSNAWDPYFGVYNSDMEFLYAGYSWDFQYNFDVKNTYYIYFEERYDHTDTETDDYIINVTKLSSATSMEIVGMGGNLSVNEGDRRNLWVNFYPEDSIRENVFWSSDNETVATIGDYGEVSFLTVGTVNITATSENGLTATCTITVKEMPVLTTEQPVMISIPDGTGIMKFVPTESGRYKFSSSASFTYFYLYDNNWEQLRYGYRSFEYALDAGCTYYIEYDDYSDYYLDNYYVSVAKMVPATGIEITRGDTFSGYVGQEASLIYKMLPDNAIWESVTWSSSDDEIVSVEEGFSAEESFGQITLHKAGTAVITATSKNGLTATCTVTVKEPEIITTEQSVEVSILDRKVLAKFIPTESGKYRFETCDNIWDPYYVLYDENMDFLCNDYYYLDYEFEAGKTYYIYCNENYDREDTNGYYYLSVKKANNIVKGDIDGDAKTNLNDLVTIAQYAAGWNNLEINNSALDVNGDGNVDLEDVNHLARYLAGWEGVVLH